MRRGPGPGWPGSEAVFRREAQGWAVLRTAREGPRAPGGERGRRTDFCPTGAPRPTRRTRSSAGEAGGYEPPTRPPRRRRGVEKWGYLTLGRSRRGPQEPTSRARSRLPSILGSRSIRVPCVERSRAEPPRNRRQERGGEPASTTRSARVSRAPHLPHGKHLGSPFAPGSYQPRSRPSKRMNSPHPPHASARRPDTSAFAVFLANVSPPPRVACHPEPTRARRRPAR
jgi:hypothetical protein